MTNFTLDSFKETFGKKQEPKPYNVYFIADLHCNHANILKFQPNRITAMNLSGEDDVKGMDDYIYKMWNDTVKRGDHIYLLGDVCLGTMNDAQRCIYKLKQKGVNLHLIVGNHDKHIPKISNQFSSIDYIKTVTFKKSVFTYMDEDLRVCLCHYPMLSWPDKCRGAALVYGHVHSHYPFIDEETPDLMVNAGFDAPLANHKLISLQDLWQYFKNKRGDLSALDYVENERKTYDKFVG